MHHYKIIFNALLIKEHTIIFTKFFFLNRNPDQIADQEIIKIDDKINISTYLINRTIYFNIYIK
jgi:hypothetical protein